MLDGLRKVSDGLEKARAFFNNISHLGVRDIKSPLSFMPPYWAPLYGSRDVRGQGGLGDSPRITQNIVEVKSFPIIFDSMGVSMVFQS